jgi:cytochrome oxidase Cu insertion factor (SCO1/SenC/PrrC family)
MIDPERNTVDAFNTYAKKNDLDADTWTFLRGDPGDILEVAALLGVK